MKCPVNSTIQAYIDGELTPDQATTFVTHLSACNDCRERVEKQRKLASDFKRIMALNTSAIEKVPAFTIKTTQSYSAKILIWELIAACVILMLILFAPELHTGKQSEIAPLIQGSKIDIDANKPITDQGIVLIYVDDKGMVKEYVD